MRHATQLVQFSALLVGCFFSLATSAPRRDSMPPSDDTWMVANVFDGQTAFPINGTIDLAVGWDDFSSTSTIVGREVYIQFDDDEPSTGQNEDGYSEATAALSKVSLQKADGTPVPFTVAVQKRTSRISPNLALLPNTEYILSLDNIADAMSIIRPAPGTIRFSTTKELHVLDVWQNNSTVIVAFSAPVNSDTAILGTTYIDFIWKQNEQLYSLAGDTNTADYLYETDGNLFMISSLNFLSAFPTWLRIGPNVTGLNAEPVVPSTEETNTDGLVFLPIDWAQLDICQVRIDAPEPCITIETQAVILANGQWQ